MRTIKTDQTCTDVQTALILRLLHTSEGTFSHVEAHL